LWRRAESVDKNNEVLVLGQDDCFRAASSVEDLWIFDVS
jgi:hypothetical protein